MLRSAIPRQFTFLARQFANSSMASISIVRSSETIGPIEELIIEKVSTLNPTSIKVANDSSKHRHHKSMQEAENVQELHFRLEVISDAFVGKNMPSRHRLIYKLLEDELQNKGLHALQMVTKTVAEAEKAQNK